MLFNNKAVLVFSQAFLQSNLYYYLIAPREKRTFDLGNGNGTGLNLPIKFIY